MKKHIYPVKIVESNLVEDPQNLLVKKSLQISLTEPKVTSFSAGSHIILDFGKEMCGGVRILTFARNEAQIHIRFGESLTECCSTLGGEQNATNDHAMRDFTAVLPKLSDVTLGQTGFRFVRIDFLEETKIKSILAVNYILDQAPVYRYAGQDKLIEAIYETAKRTVDLCAAQGYVWDGVKRDRLVWIGDIHPEMLALTTLYGRVPAIERSLEFIRKQTPLPGWMNRYPMYSMWWIIILADYYVRVPATAFVKRQLPYLQALIRQFNAHVKENGELDYPSYFVDWPTKGQPDVLHGARAINIIAAKKAIALLGAFGQDTTGAQALLDKLLKIEIAPARSKQVTALKFFATELTDADRQRLAEGGAHGMSTFMSYYILKAVASFDKPLAIEMMKQYYGAMLDKGATTFWEDFDMEWAENSCRIDQLPQPGQRDIHGDFGAYCYKGFRHSLCHGWSAGVLRFIEEECT